MKLVTDQPGHPPIIWQWMTKRNHLPWSTSLRTVALMRDDGSIAGAIGYDSWSPSACWMHIALENKHCFSKSLLRAAFDYPFVKCGLDAVYGLTSKDLPEAIQFNEKIGFRRLAETVDCVIFEMKAQDCRWIRQEERHGQEESTAAA